MARFRESPSTSANAGARRATSLLFCLVLALTAFLILPASEAAAQQYQERRSILDIIFGPRESYPPPPQRVEPPPQPSRQQPSRSRSSSGRSSAPAAQPAAAPSPPPVEKAEDARTVLVVGDFMASGLAEGLEAAFAESPDIVIASDTNGSSGLVRDDFYDWPGSLPGILETADPAILVVMLGSNDRQQISADGQTAELLTDRWKAEYAARVDAIAAIADSAEVPLIWVGAPAFQSPRMSADILAINQIYRDRMDAAGGIFVDIWDGFVDENGGFIFTGSDVQGQQVRLRGSDGINMTAAGKRKLAFYAERSIRRLIEEEGASPIAALVGPDGLAPAETARPREPELVTRTVPIAFTDPALDGGEALLGNGETYAPELRSPRDRLVEDGMTAVAPIGRADDFRWPRRSEETDARANKSVRDTDAPTPPAPAEETSAMRETDDTPD